MNPRRTNNLERREPHVKICEVEPDRPPLNTCRLPEIHTNLLFVAKDTINDPQLLTGESLPAEKPTWSQHQHHNTYSLKTIHTFKRRDVKSISNSWYSRFVLSSVTSKLPLRFRQICDISSTYGLKLYFQAWNVQTLSIVMGPKYEMLYISKQAEPETWWLHFSSSESQSCYVALVYEGVVRYWGNVSTIFCLELPKDTNSIHTL